MEKITISTNERIFNNFFFQRHKITATLPKTMWKLLYKQQTQSTIKFNMR